MLPLVDISGYTLKEFVPALGVSRFGTTASYA
jgi:hypothetical protein